MSMTLNDKECIHHHRQDIHNDNDLVDDDILHPKIDSSRLDRA